jgi:NADH-quinone oxidoreductase subunit J
VSVFFLLLITSFSFFVISSRNPIHSVLSLVCVFLISSILLLFLEAEFLALSFVIIYVGAIAILFLFVVMMLDIKIVDNSFDFVKHGSLAYLICFIFSLEVILPSLFLTNPVSEISSPTVFCINWSSEVDSFSNLTSLGLLLYTHYFIFFLMAGFILLVAVFGVLMLLVSLNKHAPFNQSFTKKKLLKKGLFLYTL